MEILDLFRLSRNNWVFIQYYQQNNMWRAYFTQHVHGKPDLSKNDILETIEKMKFSTIKELKDVINQFIYQIETRRKI